MPRLGAGTGATDAAPAFEKSPTRQGATVLTGPSSSVGGVPRAGWREQQPAARASICRGLPLLSPTLRKSGGGASGFTKNAGNLELSLFLNVGL